MSRQRNTIRAGVLLVVLQATAAASSFDWVDPGTKIASAASPVLNSANLGFNFQLFGNSYSAVTVPTQGYLAFTGSMQSGQATDANMAHSDVVRIAPAWWDSEVIDQNPGDSAAGIFLNTGIAGEAVISWVNMGYYIPANSFSSAIYPAPNELSTFQVILKSDGSVVFNFKQLNDTNPTGSADNSLDSAPQFITGIANNDGSTPFANANLVQAALGQATFTTCTSAGACEGTVYQTVANPLYSGGNGVLLQDSSVTFTSTGGNGWYVSQGGVALQQTTTGTPEPATFGLLLSICVLGVIFRRKLTHC